jgi:hypothetical protein
MSFSGAKVAFLDWCPPDLTDDLRNFGAQSWPEAQAVLRSA